MLSSKVAVLLFFAVACGKSSGGETQEGDHAEGSRILGLAVKTAESKDKSRRDGLIKAKAEIVPRADLGPCAVKIAIPSFAQLGYDGKSVAIATRMMEGSDDAVSITEAEHLATAAGPKAQFLNDQMHPLGGVLPPNDDPNGSQFPKVRALADGPGWTYDATLVIDAAVAPVFTDSTHYIAGAIVGRMYVWSYKDEKVICASLVGAKSSSEMTVIGNNSQPPEAEAAMNDLRYAAVRNAIDALVAAGPPVVPDAGAALDAGAKHGAKR